MSTRRLIPSASPLEPVIGFSRAVRVDGLICVAGTAPIGANASTVGVGDATAQTQRCFEIVEQALRAARRELP